MKKIYYLVINAIKKCVFGKNQEVLDIANLLMVLFLKTKNKNIKIINNKKSNVNFLYANGSRKEATASFIMDPQ